MRKIILTLLLALVYIFSNAQTKQIDFAATISAMKAYRGTATTLIVTDVTTGGTYYLYTGATNTDEITIFAGTGGRKWRLSPTNLLVNNNGSTTINNYISDSVTYRDSIPLGKGLVGKLVIDTQGDTAWTIEVDSSLKSAAHTIKSTSNGSTVALTAHQYNIISAGGSISTLTITLPSSPANNDIIEVRFLNAITTLTYGGGTVVAGPTTIIAGQGIKFIYDSATTTWY